MDQYQAIGQVDGRITLPCFDYLYPTSGALEGPERQVYFGYQLWASAVGISCDSLYGPLALFAMASHKMQ